MRVVVVGASGNVGTAIVGALAGRPDVEVVGIARRRPSGAWPDVTFEQADVANDPLDHLFDGADVVVHLAWILQPIRDRARLHAVNVLGTKRVVEAVLRAEVPALVYASSVGAYAPGPTDGPVDEDWPATGVPRSIYSQQKAQVEGWLDDVEQDHPELRLVRMRTALVFQEGAASEIARYFLGPFVPLSVVGRRVPVVPRTRGLEFQVVHADDAADAYVRAVLDEVRGPFNVAADPVLDPDVLGRVLGGRPVPITPSVLRALAAATFRLRLHPTSPGWVDLGLGAPTMDTERARRELGWTPRHDAVETLGSLLAGFASRAGMPTAPLRPRRGGRLLELPVPRSSTRDPAPNPAPNTD